jgi:spore coat protein CotH
MKKITFSTTIICLVFGIVFFSLASTKDKPDYNLVFENDDILSFHINVVREDWLKMWDSPFKYVKCTVRFGGEVYQDVGIRFKGNSSTSVRGLKKSYKFKFDEYIKQNFHGFKTLNFNNGFKDPSLLREKLAYDLFGEAGAPAPRATFAKLYLTIPGEYDEEYIGLFTLVEQVDKVFLDARFADTQGNLFKGEGMSALAYIGDDLKRYEREYEAKLNEKQWDYSVLMRFIKMLNETPEEKFPLEIENTFDVENFLSWLAINTLLSNLDSYAGTGHNYYLYSNTSTGRFEFIPWDVNEAFGNFQMGSAQDMMELDIYEPYAKPKILIGRILHVPKFKERYIEKIKVLLDGPFQQNAMYQKIDALYKKIEKDVQSDMWKDFTMEDFKRSIEQHIQSQRRPRVDIVTGLKPFVAERTKSVKAQLTGRRRGFVPTGKDSPPIPDELSRKLNELHRLMEEKVNEGIDITEAKKMDAKSKEYVQRGDMKGAINLISKAIDLLKR